MDGLIFYKLLRILSNILIKSKLNKITIKENSVYFSFYKDGIINFEYRCLPTPSSFFIVDNISGIEAGALSSLSGAVVTDIKSFGYERAGYIEVKKRKPSGKIDTYKLVLEPMGNYANFFLTDEADIILYSLSSRSIDKDRNIGVGNKYIKPRANKRYNLDNYIENISFNELSGFYPTLSKYADNMAERTSFDEVVSLIKSSLKDDDFFYIDKSNKVIPFPIDDYINKITYKELCNYFLVKNTPNQIKSSLNLTKIFLKKTEKYSKLKEKLEKELLLALDYEKYFKEAELIKSNLHIIKGGGSYIFKSYQNNVVEEVPYTVDFNENMQLKADKLYKKSAKLKKSIEIIKDRLEETKQIIESAYEQIYFIENSNSLDEIIAYENILKKNNTKSLKKDKHNSHCSFYKKEFDGYKIFIGRNSLSNHELVFHYAIDSDIWFHGRNIPSSHIILRLDSGKEISEDIIKQCASIAAGLSKFKKENKVDVDYTFRKYVTKPKNTPIGFVTYKNFKTITVKPMEEDMLKKLFF